MASLLLRSPANTGSIPVLAGEMNWLKYPETAFSDNGNRYKDLARIAELERRLGRMGVQYASRDYVDCLKKHNIQIGMARKVI